MAPASAVITAAPPASRAALVIALPPEMPVATHALPAGAFVLARLPSPARTAESVHAKTARSERTRVALTSMSGTGDCQPSTCAISYVPTMTASAVTADIQMRVALTRSRRARAESMDERAVERIGDGHAGREHQPDENCRGDAASVRERERIRGDLARRVEAQTEQQSDRDRGERIRRGAQRCGQERGLEAAK